jgi:hypothetical protein
MGRVLEHFLGVDRPYVPTPVLAVDHRIERRGDDAVAAPGVEEHWVVDSRYARSL